MDVPDTLGGQKRVPNYLELELRVVVCNVSPGVQTWTVCDEAVFPALMLFLKH